MLFLGLALIAGIAWLDNVTGPKLLLAEVRKLVARLQEQSLTDELTGVATRRAFLDVAAREIERSRRYRHDLSLAYLDIDNLKAANDRCGHAGGDGVRHARVGTARSTATDSRLLRFARRSGT